MQSWARCCAQATKSDSCQDCALPRHGAMQSHESACASCCAQGSGLYKCTVLCAAHTHLGSVLHRGAPCPWWPAEVSAVVWGAALQLLWSLQPCAPLQPPPAAAIQRCLVDLQTSTHMSPAAVPLTELSASPTPSCPCGIVSAHEQQLQPASMVHCRPPPQCAPLQQLCHHAAIRQAGTATECVTQFGEPYMSPTPGSPTNPSFQSILECTRVHLPSPWGGGAAAARCS